MGNTVNSKKVIAVILSVFMVAAILLQTSAYAVTYCTLTYTAGDVDNIVGSQSVSFQKIINTTFDAADSSRLSRKGYYIKSWYVPLTGETVSTCAQYTMPSYDITFVANWEPQTYSITFTGKGGKTSDGSSNFYVDGTYGTSITLPENQFTYDGYTFSGWKYSGVTYKAGDAFELPALLSGTKIVFAAVWTKNSSTTTTVTTPVTTTTTTTITTTTTTTTTTNTTTTKAPETSTSAVVTAEAVVKTFDVDAKLDFTDESKKTYNIPLDEVLSYGTIDKIQINLRSTIGAISTLVAGVGTTVDGNWYQIDYNESNITAARYTIDFATPEICNKINGSSLQVGYWYGKIVPLYIDSITVTYKPQEITQTTTTEPVTTQTTTVTTTVTTTETTTTPETTTVTTTVTTPATTTETTTVTTTVTTTTTTVPETEPVTTKTTTTFKPSQYSKVIDINKTISMGNALSLPSSEIISANQIVESVQLTFSTEGQPIGSHTMTLGISGKNGNWEQFGYNDSINENRFTVGTAISEKSQAYVNVENYITIGYWWGSAESITLESVKVNYRIDEGDFNMDGVVDSTDAELLKKFMVGSDTEDFYITSEEADINKDGIINVFDYMAFTRLIG